jgi:hypothetical protein
MGPKKSGAAAGGATAADSKEKKGGTSVKVLKIGNILNYMDI